MICKDDHIKSAADGIFKFHLSHDVASGSDIMTCNKIDKPLVVYRSSNVTCVNYNAA